MTTTTIDRVLRMDEIPSLDRMLDEAAQKLHDALTTGYIDGYERTLTDELLNAYLPAGGAQREQAVRCALEFLVHNQLGQYIGVICLLDETDDASYDAIDTMTDTLVGAIFAQGGQAQALHELVLHEIDDRQRYARRVSVA